MKLVVVRVRAPLSFLIMKLIVLLLLHVHSVDSAPKAGGSLRKRLLEAADNEPAGGGGASSSSSTLNTRSLRARLAETVPAGASGGGQERPLVDSLRKHWSEGKVTAAQVQEYAAGAEAQGATGVGELAGAGSHGQHPQNIQRKC